eukprot:scaffold5832_cov109-Isochrysis_galbana.AAC.3
MASPLPPAAAPTSLPRQHRHAACLQHPLPPMPPHPAKPRLRPHLHPRLQTRLHPAPARAHVGGVLPRLELGVYNEPVLLVAGLRGRARPAHALGLCHLHHRPQPPVRLLGPRSPRDACGVTRQSARLVGWLIAEDDRAGEADATQRLAGGRSGVGGEVEKPGPALGVRAAAARQGRSSRRRACVKESTGNDRGWAMPGKCQLSDPVAAGARGTAAQERARAFMMLVMKQTWYMGLASSMWPKWPGHSWWSMPQVVQFIWRSIEPSRGSISPFATGLFPSNVRSDSMWQTDIALISSGPRMPNCTRFTLRMSASEYWNILKRPPSPPGFAAPPPSCLPRLRRGSRAPLRSLWLAQGFERSRTGIDAGFIVGGAFTRSQKRKNNYRHCSHYNKQQERQRTPHEEAPARGDKPSRGALSAPHVKTHCIMGRTRRLEGGCTRIRQVRIGLYGRSK